MCPEGSPQSMGAWATRPGPASCLSAGAGEGGQVPGSCCPLSSPQEALLIPCPPFSLGFASSSANLILHTISIGICPQLLGPAGAFLPLSLPGQQPLVPSGVAAVAAAALLNSGQTGKRMGTGWGSPSEEVTPLPAAPQPDDASASAASAAACLSPRSSPCGFLISTSTAVSPCVCHCERASERGQALLRHAAPCSPSRSAQHVLRSPPHA